MIVVRTYHPDSFRPLIILQQWPRMDKTRSNWSQYIKLPICVTSIANLNRYFSPDFLRITDSKSTSGRCKIQWLLICVNKECMDSVFIGCWTKQMCSFMKHVHWREIGRWVQDVSVGSGTPEYGNNAIPKQLPWVASEMDIIARYYLSHFPKCLVWYWQGSGLSRLSVLDIYFEWFCWASRYIRNCFMYTHYTEGKIDQVHFLCLRYYYRTYCLIEYSLYVHCVTCSIAILNSLP